MVDSVDILTNTIVTVAGAVGAGDVLAADTLCLAAADSARWT